MIFQKGTQEEKIYWMVNFKCTAYNQGSYLVALIIVHSSGKTQITAQVKRHFPCETTLVVVLSILPGGSIFSVLTLYFQI